MGWSCRADAGRTLDSWTQACVASTGMSNTYDVGGKRYFFEVSRTEHHDGAITGKVMRMLPADTEGRCFCKPSGSFRINGDGSIERGPKFLKDAIQIAAEDAHEYALLQMEIADERNSEAAQS